MDKFVIRGGNPLVGTVRVSGAKNAALPAMAQIGPITNQNLFFDQASNTYRGNYLAVDAGLVYTDNVTRTRSGSADTLALLGLVGDTARQGPRLVYRLASDLALVKYLHSSYETQPFGYLDGTGELWIVPGFFAWTGRETYTQTVLDPRSPITPNNLEGLNYASTGPRFTLRPTLRTTITLNGTASYVSTNSKSPSYVNIDNHRYEGDLTLSRAFSNTSSVYIMGLAEKVEFTDQVVNTNFTQERGLIGYRLGDARTTLDLSGGYTRLRVVVPEIVPTPFGPRRILQKQTRSGSTWRVELSRLISSSTRLSLHALQQITDAANMFRMNLDQPVASTAADRLTTSDPFTDREVGGTLRFQQARTSLTLGYLDIRENYKVHPTSDRHVKDATAFLGRQLSPVLHWDLGAEYERQNFGIGGSSNTVNAITSLHWQVAQPLGVRFLYAHSALTPHGYTDNQVGVTVSYAFTEGGAPGSPAPLTPGTLPGSSPPPRPQ